MTREDNLILSILKLKDGKKVDLQGVNLEWFLTISRKEGLSALLFQILNENGQIRMFPAYIQKSMRESYLLSLTRNILLMNDLSMLILSLEEKGIRAIVLKGAALLERVYTDVGVRPIMDIDLLCEEEEKVKEILEGLGYQLTSACPRIYNNGRTLIDIHTDVDSFTRVGPIPGTPRLSTITLWENGSPWGAGFDSVRILSPEDTVLTLSIHFMKHSFLRLLWLIDIIKVIEKHPQFDWKRMGETAKEAGFERLIYYVMSYISEVFGVIPEDFLSGIKPERMGLVEKKIMERIINNERKEGYGEILYLYMISGTFKRVLFAMRLLFPSRKKAIEMSGSRYPYLYYPKRVLELFGMGGRLLWNHISINRSATHSRSEGSCGSAVSKTGGGRV